jgi:serine/threonine protein kinase
MTAQPLPQASFETGAVVGGKYRIVSLIGVGGVGRVYLARHIELDTDVAIKVLRPEMSNRADAVQRFAREARASVRLRSERIARVLDVGTHEGKPYFVMEYMVGCNLLEARQQPDVDIATLCEFFIQACEGLADAHAQGVVHRDIKPENLFVVRDASGWRSLKVFDFGISKFSLTGRFSDVDVAGLRTESMMGTPHYISPEQIRSTREVDHRSDLWSLGAVMFEVLTGGVLPFREEREVTALVAEVLERPHRSLLDVAPNVPERLAAIVDRCLTKDRDLRYQTAAEIALDLLPLAPARARASAERAVSVMQGAGLMALNGDLESLRQMPTLLSDRPVSSRMPSSGVVTAERTSTAPPLTANVSVSPATYALTTAATPRPGGGPGPAVSAEPASPRVTRSTSLAAPPTAAPTPSWPSAAPLKDEAQARRRRAALVLLLVAAGFIALVLLLTRRPEAAPTALPAEPPRAQPATVPATQAAAQAATVPAAQAAPIAAPASVAAEAAPDQVAAEPSVTPPATAPALPAAMAAPKAPPKPAPRSVVVARPVVAAPLPPKQTPAPSFETSSPPPNKLELRRER